MKRKAILLAASPGNNPIPGVFADMNAFSTYLKSNVGGAWASDEIICENNPTRDQIVRAVKEAITVDYTMVYFAGHGEATKSELPWTETRMYLSSGETITEREINPGSPRCTLIMDCCLRMPDPDEGKLLTKTSMLSESINRGAEYHNLYMNNLSAAESGLVKIFVTKVGNAVADLHSFTQHLLKDSNIWASNNRGILHLGEAVELAQNSMKLENSQQQPEYRGGRRLRHFPFAVKI